MTVNTFLRSIPFFVYPVGMEEPAAKPPTQNHRQGRAYTLYLPLDLLGQLQEYRWQQRFPSLKALIVTLLVEALERRKGKV